MNPYQVEVVCDVCGGRGMARGGDAASVWLGGKLAHSDPNICRDVLKRRADALKKRETAEAAEVQS